MVVWIFPIHDGDCLSWVGTIALNYIEWTMELDIGYALFSSRGQASMVLGCLLSLWRCDFQSTICIYPFYVILEWLVWIYCMIVLEKDGGRRRNLQQKEDWEAH
jgi:hypothetical protein